MRDRESQVGDAGFEVIHEACDRAVVFAAVVGIDADREFARDGPARRLIGRLRADLEVRPDILRHLGRQVAHAMRQATLSGAARGKQISIALMMPGAPSEVTRSGSFRPRLFMSSKNAVTVSASSLEPAIMCSSTRRPSMVKSQAARTGSRFAPGRKRSAMPSTNRYVISYSLKSRCVNAR